MHLAKSASALAKTICNSHCNSHTLDDAHRCSRMPAVIDFVIASNFTPRY